MGNSLRGKEVKLKEQSIRKTKEKKEQTVPA